MSILSIITDLPDDSGFKPRIVKIVCDDSYEAVTAQDYLKTITQSGYPKLYHNDLIILTYVDNVTGLFLLNFSDQDVSLVPLSPVIKLAENKILVGNPEGIASAVPRAPWVTKYAGSITSTGGSGTTENYDIPSVLDTDLCLVTMQVQGATPRTILASFCQPDQLTVTYSGDPGNDTVINAFIFGATAS